MNRSCFQSHPEHLTSQLSADNLNLEAICSLCDPGMRHTTGDFPVSTMAATKGKEGPFRREGTMTSVSAKQVAACCLNIYLHTELHFCTSKYNKLLVAVFLLHATDFSREGMTSSEFCYSENALLTHTHKIINLKINVWHQESHIHNFSLICLFGARTIKLKIHLKYLSPPKKHPVVTIHKLLEYLTYRKWQLFILHIIRLNM